MSDQPVTYQPESQSQRWVKYGTNVAVSSVVVIAIAVLLVYLAQLRKKPWDTTAAGNYSLKPQSVKLIEDNKQKIKIVSLYTRSKPPEQDQTATTDGPTQVDLDAQATAVDDLLDEYRSGGKNISVESIDPIKDPEKVNDLINQTGSQYSEQVDAYKKFTDDVKPIYESIEKAADAEVGKIALLPQVKLKSSTARSFELAFVSVYRVPDILRDSETTYQQKLRERIPNYKAVTDNVGEAMSQMSNLLDKTIDGFNKVQADATAPAEFRKYVADNLNVYVEMKKQADGLLTRQKGLGELKLDTLKTALAQRNPILVRGEKSWKVIPYDQVWQAPARTSRNRSDDTGLHQLFSGEQAITTAVLALNEVVKPKVCFVRGGGQPRSTEGGQYFQIADRLRLYNYDVTDKDLSGQYAMMAAQQQQPAAPEPSDADLVDAIWVVSGEPAERSQQEQMMGAPSSPPIGQFVADHIAKGFHYENGVKIPGGVAMILAKTGLQSENFGDALSPFGITLRTDAEVVHEGTKLQRNSDQDFYDFLSQIAPVFIVTAWGDHPITTPIQALPGLAYPEAVIQSHSMAGVKCTPLIPLIATSTVWGETDLSSADERPKYVKDKAINGPFYGAYAAETKGSRVVVVGAGFPFFGSGEFGNYPPILSMNDQFMEEKGITRIAFPGDAEFFMNSIFWLGHRESMIAMSPSAMTVSRIGTISPGLVNFWHVGILLIAIPGLAIAAGVTIFFARRS